MSAERTYVWVTLTHASREVARVLAKKSAKLTSRRVHCNCTRYLSVFGNTWAEDENHFEIDLKRIRGSPFSIHPD